VLQFTKRDVNHRTSQVLDQIAEVGTSAVVTERGVPKWRIEPITPKPLSPIERGVREGWIEPHSENPPPWSPQRPSSRTHAEVDALVQEMKGDL
jgi:antitoxin (DNA-binding transcriptional repressor) of toxin-antitoxin stability system